VCRYPFLWNFKVVALGGYWHRNFLVNMQNLKVNVHITFIIPNCK
jgi:hypothetical protein